MAKRIFLVLCFCAFVIIFISYVHLNESYPSIPKYIMDRFYKSSTWSEYLMNKNRVHDHPISVSKNQCLIPNLLIADPTLSSFMKHYEPLQCSPTTNWVYTMDGKFYIYKKIADQFSEVKCDYFNIRRLTDDKFDEYPIVKDIKNGTELIGDSFRVVCKGTHKGFFGLLWSKKMYTNVHIGVPKLQKSLSSVISTANQTASPNRSHVFIFLLDSMSRINFIRKLPNFYKFLTDDMNGLIMDGFNVVGDGTPWAVIPMTTGKFQTELPEARKRFKNSSYLDDWPFVWKEYEKSGYITSYAEEQPAFSAFSYKLKGFRKKPFHHYFRSMLFAAEKEKPKHKTYCLGDTPKSLIWPKFWREFRRMYDRYERKTFSFLFSSETSHDDYNMVQVLDKHLAKEFANLHKQNLLDDTFLFVMGDHGRRFGPVRQTQSGKLEEKLPFLAIAPPKNYPKTNPKNYANLRRNTNRLITVFDLHATLLSILNEPDDDRGSMGSVTNRSISLFDEVPVERTCDAADIKPHFCSCLIWTDVVDAINDTVVVEAATMIVEKFNALISEVVKFCSNLSLHGIVSARTAAPSDTLMAFHESSDYDNYFPNLSGNKKITSVLYQIRFVTTPGLGDWEASLTYFTDIKQFIFHINDVSRLNQYGDQAKCIINTHQHLRQFCFCLK